MVNMLYNGCCHYSIITSFIIRFFMDCRHNIIGTIGIYLLLSF